MTLKLGPVNKPEQNLPCALTMLCAMSGQAPDDMGLLLRKICAANGRTTAARRNEYAPRDWLQAVKQLGATVVTTNYNPMPTIDDWMKQNTSQGIMVVAYASDQLEIANSETP